MQGFTRINRADGNRNPIIAGSMADMGCIEFPAVIYQVAAVDGEPGDGVAQIKHDIGAGRCGRVFRNGKGIRPAHPRVFLDGLLLNTVGLQDKKRV